MNVSRLRELLDLLLTKDEQYRAHEALNAIQTQLNQLVDQPQNADAQSNFSKALDELQAKYAQLRSSWQPAQVPLIEEIGATNFFYDDFSAKVAASIRENPISPAVTKRMVDKFIAARNAFIKRITQLRDDLKALGIEPNKLEPGQAEIGFLLPRDLFENRLDELVDELHDIDRIIRAFSEVTTGSAEEVKLSDISTSDPLFGFILSAATIAALAKAVTWALDTWERVDKIRKARNEMRKSEIFSDDELNELFEKKIKAQIDSALSEQVDELAKDDGSPGRVKEQRIDLRWAMESILAHIERGMTVEVRFVPPRPPPDTPKENLKLVTPAEFAALEKLASQLAFPRMEGNPILQLPPQPKAGTRS